MIHNGDKCQSGGKARCEDENENENSNKYHMK